MWESEDDILQGQILWIYLVFHAPWSRHDSIAFLGGYQNDVDEQSSDYSLTKYKGYKTGLKSYWE